MKSYIITIIGAALLSSIGAMLTPDSMKKYVSVITGFIIIAAIVSPLSSLTKINIFSGFDEISLNTQNYEQIYSQSVEKALTDRIESEIEERLKDEFQINADVSVSLLVENENIKSIKNITISTATPNKNIVKRLMEVYNVNEVTVNGKKYIKENNTKQE